MHKKRLPVAVVLLTCWIAGVAAGQEAEPQQSRTGPKPPASVPPKGQMQLPTNATSRTIAGVPGYLWRHGCGPTAVGMVVGYYDAQGYTELYPGSAVIQTADVNQGIASQGSGVRGSGTQLHYEDYSLPMDSDQSSPLTDSSATYPTGCHISDCIADFMHTSWSRDGNFYGWSYSSKIATSFTSYVNLRRSGYSPAVTQYMMGSSLTWAVLTNEIDNNRPMVFLVDSSGDGGTDHFVTIVGYSDSPSQQYGCLDTWAPAGSIRWCGFRAMSSTYSWGVWGGWKFTLRPMKAVSPSPATESLNVSPAVTLNWANGGGASSYDVYVGTSSALGPDDLNSTQAGTSFTPDSLGLAQTCYWRVDTRAVDNTLTTGDVWQFRTLGVFGDFDGDDDVDQTDFGHLQVCMAALSVPLPAECADADLDANGIYDAEDFNRFQACFRGPVPTELGCGL